MGKEFEIVIVEDNPNDSELMIRSLQKNQLSNNLILLEDGEQALDFFYKRGKYKDRNACASNLIVFLDLKLPKVNGLEILKQLKSDPNTKKIPVVILTSSKEDPDIEAAYELGANSYVVKPVNYERFVETIKQLGLYWLVVNKNAKNGI
jgi:two-component system, response regulator